MKSESKNKQCIIGYLMIKYSACKHSIVLARRKVRGGNWGVEKCPYPRNSGDTGSIVALRRGGGWPADEPVNWRLTPDGERATRRSRVDQAMCDVDWISYGKGRACSIILCNPARSYQMYGRLIASPLCKDVSSAYRKLPLTNMARLELYRILDLSLEQHKQV